MGAKYAQNQQCDHMMAWNASNCNEKSEEKMAENRASSQGTGKRVGGTNMWVKCLGIGWQLILRSLLLGPGQRSTLKFLLKLR